MNLRQPSSRGLAEHGLLQRSGHDFWNLGVTELVEHALHRREGVLVEDGALSVVTAPHTGRSPGDRYIVHEPSSADRVDWGEVNRPMATEAYLALRESVVQHMADGDLFVRDAWAGADGALRSGVRVISTSAWSSLFARNMFRVPALEELNDFTPHYTILHAPELAADPAVHGTRSGTFIVLNLGRGEILIGGTRCAGEIKKSIFSVMNYLLPLRNVLPMHCSAYLGDQGDVALFFGLSGTGKTTLSADPERHLIRDDEHGWSDEGVFNFEGGCYAKVIRLSQDGEPEIYAASRRFGSVLENCAVGIDRRVRFESDEITENTRSSYPLDFIPGAVPDARAGHPSTIFFLTADAYGVLSPIARLTREQAMYYFLAGYTAKVAGTERGVTAPIPTYSACFGAPFLPLAPARYAELLGRRIEAHEVSVWLVNTGWSGGPAGKASRIPLAYTRAMVAAAAGGQLDDVAAKLIPVFELQVPIAVPGVPTQILRPRDVWENVEEYDATARELAAGIGAAVVRLDGGATDQ